MEAAFRRGAVVLCLLSSVSAAVHAQIQADVIYGHKDGMALVYDVFQPAEPNGAGIIFMVSGGWFSVWQPPEERIVQFKAMLDEGFTVFAVHHGSAPRYKVPDAVSDARAAVRHIKSAAGTYGVDADRLGVFGGSAGGHLSLMLGLNAEALPAAPPESGRGRRLGPRYAAGTGDARVAAIVAYFPPVDLVPMVGPSERFPALDFARSEAKAISPIRFVSDGDPPTLLVHGDADGLVPIRNSEALAAELDKVGVVHEFLVIEGGDHGFRNPDHSRRARDAMLAWFRTHLLDAP